MNPPWCLTKVQAQAVVPKTPLWPMQPWYPLVLELLEDYTCKFQQHDLVSGPRVHNAAAHLIIWYISGNPMHHEAFLNKFRTLRLPHG